MTHALSIGGTGMLAAATHWLEDQGYEVSVFSRHANAFCDGHARLHPHEIDWMDNDALLATIEEALDPPAALALIWYHKSWRGLPLATAKAMSTAGDPFDLYLVLGSAVSDPARPRVLDGIKAGFAEIDGCRLHLVLLGFAVESGKSRWLTNEEISGGTIAAMISKAPDTMIGVTRPWDARP